MIYSDIKFKKLQNRPFFYTSFVSTIDGKVQVGKKSYWPIGSKIDYEIFTYLRAHADVIIDGKNTALKFGKNTIETINSEKFKKLRKDLKKTKQIEYIIVTKNSSEDLKSVLKNNFNFQPTIFTKDINQLINYLKKKALNNIFIDGGPNLLASFFEKNLIDEVFLTIAPKIFGNKNNLAITMVENILFEPEKIKLKLISLENKNNEVFLRYKVLH